MVRDSHRKRLINRRPRGCRLHTKVKVKTARGRKISSTLWLQRQLNDPYVQLAKAEGYASRSAYKLLEIDDRYNLFHSGQRIIDLGSAPGGWCQIAVERISSHSGDIRVVGIDNLDMNPVAGATILKKDFLDIDAPELLLESLGGHQPDIVMSDMASKTIGHRTTDQIRTIALVESALEFAVEVLVRGGHFLSKTFQGSIDNKILSLMKTNFKSFHHVKPPASRDQSCEIYLLAKGRR
ncbi:RlmE family RNA methyltransferase [Candidatus Endowatersipora endosymbiont of Watersipora subatra]|uniref:RlmE family RNA methyltransferase n=1 Tax=Candidatus Endowatersipora endosymbiont of Watersipora subatra TaxID=3077946 RepID=UPI00312CB44C